MGVTLLRVFLFLLLISICNSYDRLTPAEPLSTGDKLISHGGIFALGFFSPTNSFANSYVSIWYNKIPIRTYVWVANRDNPIASSSPRKLVLTNGSDLVLSDSEGQTLWTTTNSISPGGIKTTAILLDSGNLVIRLLNGTDIWQSFHHPTDTMLPDMNLPLSKNTSMHLVAWRGTDDPSSSDYSFGGDSSLQIFVWNGTRPYWRRAALNGVADYAMYQRNGLGMTQTIVNRGEKTGALKIALPVLACLLIPVCIYLFWLLKSRGKHQTNEPMDFAIPEQLANSDELYNQNSEFLQISFEDIIPATNGFSDSNVLGKGGFGIVYKGTLKGGKEVAIKRLTKCSDQGIKHFKNEVVLIAKLQHQNLVRLLGYCIRGDEMLLIYEYLPNKSLDYYLFRQHADDAKKFYG
ncbi:hypothetical protein ACQ4PT_012353 [Festuca glaucescens]